MERYYLLQANMPVGDAPRQADLVLLRRTSTEPLPFQGLWKDLTTWDVLEFKGPTVSPRLGDLDLLVELGLGIHRRLNEERLQQKLSPLGPGEMSFWYLTNRLGRRFLRGAEQRLGHLEVCGSGVWRCPVLQRMVFLVSTVHLPVDEDSLPLHLLAKESPATALAVGHFLAEHPALWQHYGPWLWALHPTAYEEVRTMARAAGKGLKIDLRPAIDAVGLDEFIRQVGLKRLVEEAGPKRVRDEMGLDWLLSQLTPAERRELKRRLQ
jgi:hypothetical protein